MKKLSNARERERRQIEARTHTANLAISPPHRKFFCERPHTTRWNPSVSTAVWRERKRKSWWIVFANFLAWFHESLGGRSVCVWARTVSQRWPTNARSIAKHSLSPPFRYQCKFHAIPTHVKNSWWDFKKCKFILRWRFLIMLRATSTTNSQLYAWLGSTLRKLTGEVWRWWRKIYSRIVDIRQSKRKDISSVPCAFCLLDY